MYKERRTAVHPEGPGPWADEPDEVWWLDEATGLLCEVLRHQLGHLCGYVEVPEGHPWHGRSLYVPADVHGGITFSESVNDRWVVGFDAAHMGDLVPGLLVHPEGAAYRTVEYMRAECTKLAAAIQAAA